MLKLFIHLLITTLMISYATPLLKTGQTKSYDPDGVEVLDGSVKDDGYYQAGTTRSYSRSGDVVTDNVTGLQWQDNESIKKPLITKENYKAENYDDTSGDTAATYCSNLSLNGGGWRLPSIEELETLVDNGMYNPSTTAGVFQYIESSGIDYYWSSTINVNTSFVAWYIEFRNGQSLNNDTKKNSNYIRCVRNGQ